MQKNIPRLLNNEWLRNKYSNNLTCLNFKAKGRTVVMSRSTYRNIVLMDMLDKLEFNVQVSHFNHTPLNPIIL